MLLTRKRPLSYIKKTLLVLLGCCWSSLVMQAQETHTAYFMHTSTFRHHLNPAFLERNAYIGLPLLSHINAGVGMNMGASTFIYKIDPAQNKGKHYGTFWHPEVSAQRFYDKIGNSPLRIKANVTYNLFSVATRNTLVEMNIRSLHDGLLPNSYLRFLKKKGGQEVYDFTDFGFRHHTYVELVGGRAIRFNKQLSLGVKVKALLGLSYADWDVEHLRVTASDERWKVSGRANASLAVFRNKIPVDSAGRFQGESHDTEFGASGWGLGFDVGATYKFKHLDDLTLSASLTDIGFMNHTYATNFKTFNGKWEFDGFERAYMGSDAQNSQHFDDELKQLNKDFQDFMGVYSTGKKGKIQGLATTLNLGAEYTFPLYKKWSVGALLSHRFNGKYSWTKALLSTRVRPLKWFELGLSASTSTYATSMGAMVSLYTPGFNCYFGSDDLFIQTAKYYIPTRRSNPNFTLGIVFPL